MTTADRKDFVSAEQALLKNQYSDLIAGNTTIAAVFTNARLSVADLQKVANIASTGMARCIRSANHGDGSEGTFNLFIIS